MCLQRRWPLLADNQDPVGREARIAFHLHRLNIPSAQLRDVLHSHRRARAVRQARAPITAAELAALARLTGLRPHDLMRPLLTTEAAEWSFYRQSAHHTAFVWHRAEAIWQSGNLTLPQAASILAYDPSLIRRTLRQPKPSLVLELPPAARLTTALQIPDGPAILLEGIGTALPPSHTLSGRVAALTQDQIARVLSLADTGKSRAR